MTKFNSLAAFLCFLFSGLNLCGFARADSLPKATQKILADLKLNPSILSGLDEELHVPGEWIEKAKIEGHLKVISTEKPAEVRKILAPFKERYPFIDVKFTASTRNDRVRTLLAFKSGKVTTDIQSAMGGIFYSFKEADALENIGNLPGFNNVPDVAKDPEGLWVGTELGYRCIGYNSRQVKKEEIPKSWDDLVTNPRWRNGVIALGNRPQLWALNLWKSNGEAWTKEFLSKLFLQDKPQLRKEGMNALHELLAAGEFDLFIPAGEDATYDLTMAGAPVGFTCPEPIPGTVREVVILKGSPNANAAKIYLNWLLSKEGQISQFAGKRGTPAHKDLMQRPEFIANAEQILGKKVVYRRTEDLTEILPAVQKYWSDLWLRSGQGR